MKHTQRPDPQIEGRWFGHVVRMSNGRLPKQLIYRELQGKRTVGGQYKRYRLAWYTFITAIHQLRPKQTPDLFPS